MNSRGGIRTRDLRVILSPTVIVRQGLSCSGRCSLVRTSIPASSPRCRPVMFDPASFVCPRFDAPARGASADPLGERAVIDTDTDERLHLCTRRIRTTCCNPTTAIARRIDAVERPNLHEMRCPAEPARLSWSSRTGLLVANVPTPSERAARWRAPVIQADKPLGVSRATVRAAGPSPESLDRVRRETMVGSDQGAALE